MEKTKSLKKAQGDGRAGRTQGGGVQVEKVDSRVRFKRKDPVQHTEGAPGKNSIKKKKKKEKP